MTTIQNSEVTNSEVTHVDRVVFVPREHTYTMTACIKHESKAMCTLNLGIKR